MKFDLKNENEIGLNDIASESDKKDLEFGKFKIDSDEEDDEDLFEYWEEVDKKKIKELKEKNPNIDVRLEDYLRSHS
jgi:hypothetical protein